jgi:hypothetical protein
MAYRVIASVVAAILVLILVVAFYILLSKDRARRIADWVNASYLRMLLAIGITFTVVLSLVVILILSLR